MAEIIQPGTVLQGTYEVIKQIGAGGGGSIYLGYHRNLKTNIAIKKIHDNGKYNQDEVFREAEILTKLRHSYLPRVYDFLILDSGVYTVMDFIPGESIDDKLKKGYKFSEKEVIRFGTQLSEVLAYLHFQKPAIIHGDVKPANIMITPEGNICLIDFNISGMADEKGNAYVIGYSAGYAAPEQFDEYKEIVAKLNAANAAWAERNVGSKDVKVTLGREETVFLGEVDDKAETVLLEDIKEPAQTEPKPTLMSLGIKGIHIDPKSDVYSVGATLYHMIMGEKVGNDGTKKAPSNISDGLILLLNKALSVNPSKRYKDAIELSKAFKDIYKLDKRYKRVMARKTFIQSLFVIMMGAGIVLTAYGLKVAANDKVTQYRKYVDEIRECGEAGDFEGLEDAFDKAVSINSTDIDAYIAKAESIFAAGGYEEVAEFTEKSISYNPDLINGEKADYFYYLQGRAYYEIGALEDAATSFSAAISLGEYNSDYYIFSALSLAQTGHPSQAAAALEMAKKLNASEDYVLLLEGEISKQAGDSVSAEEHFKECLEKTTDGYIRSRAYIFLSDVYKGQEKSEENLLKQIELLERASSEVDDSFSALVLSRLAQAYMSLHGLNDSPEYAEKAIGCYERLSKLGVADFVIYNNIVVLYEHLERYDDASATLDSIESLYSNYYGYYKRRAFLEFRIQNTKGANMDFTKLEEYYEKASTLYEKENQKTDAEMPVLDQTYANYKKAIGR